MPIRRGVGSLMDLRFESGRIAGARGWQTAEVVGTAQLAHEAPSSTPLLVEATDSLTIESARSIAALHAAGRSVVLVTDTPPAVDIAQWIPDGCLHVIGAPLTTVVREVAAPGGEAKTNGTRAFLGAPYIEEETSLESIAFDLEADEVMSLAGLLESTPITIDTDREWWMRGSIRLHGVPGGWDARNDIVANLGFVALPLKIGDSLVLGVGDVQGQDCDEGCYVVTGSWRRADDGSYGGIYTDGMRDVPGVSVGVLLKDWSGVQDQESPDPLPLSIRATPSGEQAVLEVVEAMLLAITRALLENGSHGFEAAKPHLQTWFDEFRMAAVEYLRCYT